MSYFSSPILNFILFRSYLCLNIKIFGWAIIGGVMIVPLSLRLSGIDFSLDLD